MTTVTEPRFANGIELAESIGARRELLILRDGGVLARIDAEADPASCAIVRAIAAGAAAGTPDEVAARFGVAAEDVTDVLDDLAAIGCLAGVELPVSAAPEPAAADPATIAALTVELVGAMGARWRIAAEQRDVDPAIRAALDRLAGLHAELADPAAPGAAVAALRAAFGRARDLLDDPARAPGWHHADPALLESHGATGTVVAGELATAAPQVAARLAAPGARLLDVGVGVAGLAIALARRFPALAIVGIDPNAAALALGRDHVAASGLAARIELRATDVVDLVDPLGFDVVWLPGAFLGEDVLPDAIRAARGALRAGGALVIGIQRVAPGLAGALAELQLARAGGKAWTVDAVRALLGGDATVYETGLPLLLVVALHDS